MLRSLVDRLLDTLAFIRIYNRYRASGHESPLLAANQEVFIRGELLERFRDYATSRFNLGATLDEAKSDFIREHLAAKTTTLDKQTTAAVRAIIIDMRPDEALHEEQYRRWCEEADAYQVECRVELKTQFGGTALSPLMRRVLRGR